MYGMWTHKHGQNSDGSPDAFYGSGGFDSADEVFAAITKHRKNRDQTLSNIAALVQAYEGGLSYAYVKKLPPREIEILTNTLNDIRDNEKKELDSAMSNKSGLQASSNDIKPNESTIIGYE